MFLRIHASYHKFQHFARVWISSKLIFISPSFCTLYLLEYRQIKQEEELKMKTATVSRTKNNRPVFPRPDAFTRRKMLDRCVDQLLVVAIGAACVTALLFFMTL